MDLKKFDISKLSGNQTFNPALVGYEDSIDIIENELQNTRKSFVKIGWYLKHIDEEEMFHQDGYKDIFEFAHAKFKMSGGTVNRLINICKQFSINHDSPELDEQYQEFEPSQLFEMLPMKEEEREEISSDMTVKQIREKKAENKAQKEPSEKLVKMFLRRGCVNLSEFYSALELKEFLIDRYGKSKACGGPDPNYKCTLRGISLNNCAEMTWLAFAKKAWDLKASDPLESQETQDNESCSDSDDFDPSESSGSEETPDMIMPGQTAAFAQAVAPDEEITASEGKGAVSEYPDQTALLEEACSLSQQLYEGFRFSTQHHTLSQIEDYKKCASKLNHVAHTLYELCLSRK